MRVVLAALFVLAYHAPVGIAFQEPPVAAAQISTAPVAGDAGSTLYEQKTDGQVLETKKKSEDKKSTATEEKKSAATTISSKEEDEKDGGSTGAANNKAAVKPTNTNTSGGTTNGETPYTSTSNGGSTIQVNAAEVDQKIKQDCSAVFIASTECEAKNKAEVNQSNTTGTNGGAPYTSTSIGGSTIQVNAADVDQKIEQDCLAILIASTECEAKNTAEINQSNTTGGATP
jgi:hypothetical protein